MATKNIIMLQYQKDAQPEMVEQVVRQMTEDLQIPVVGVIGARPILIPVSVDVYDDLMRRILTDD